MKLVQSLIFAVLITVGVWGGARVLAAQGTDAGPATLAGVIAELRLVRLAVEESSRTQAQTEALAAYASAQQGRIAVATARLEMARRELETLTARSRQLAADLTSNEDSASRAVATSQKEMLAAQSRTIQGQLDRLAPQLQQAQNREANCSSCHKPRKHAGRS